MPKIRDFQPYLLEALKDEEGAYFFLEAAFESKDPRVITRALNNVFKARDYSVKQISEKTKLNREHLYKIFSGKSSPAFTTIQSLCDLAGFPLLPQKPHVHAT